MSTVSNHRLCFLVVCLPLLITVQALRCEGQELRSEYEVKAAFIYNFTKFVELPNQTGPTRICLVGEDPFGSILPTLTQASTNPIEIRLIEWDDAPTDCHYVFLPRSDEVRALAFLSKNRLKYTVTISDLPNFIDNGGMIGLVLRNDRVIFEINHELAEKQGVKISSKLLRLATRVITHE